jgi:hypothetical protein
MLARVQQPPPLRPGGGHRHVRDVDGRARCGAAAIICQFLEEGWYPHFAKSTNSALPVTSALLKATDRSHDIEAGFGIPNLSAVLAFRGYGLRIVARREVGSAAHHVFRLRVESGDSDLVVTMAHLYAALSPESASRCMPTWTSRSRRPGKRSPGRVYDNRKSDDTRK